MQKSEIFYMIFDVLLFASLFNKVGNFQKLLSRLWFSLNHQINLIQEDQENKITNSQEDQENKNNHQKPIRPAADSSCSDERLISSSETIRREEVEMVMEKLGFFCSTDDEKLEESIELSKLFDEKEPSLGEIKEAFDVFDVNRDGFIDAVELQRVIGLLGLIKKEEGCDVESCTRMIRNFDGNGDGRIDFNEFVKFMENNLS